MPPARSATAAGGLVAVLLLLASCGSTNYNTDLGALASAVERASHGHVVRLTCAGEIPYQLQKKVKERIHSKSHEYRYYCKGETTGATGPPQQVTKVIRVTPNGERWLENKAEEAEPVP